MKRYRFLALALALALIAPVLLAVPVSAASTGIFYNGVELPELPLAFYECLWVICTTSSGGYQLWSFPRSFEFCYVQSSSKLTCTGTVGDDYYLYNVSDGKWVVATSYELNSGGYVNLFNDLVWSSFDICCSDGTVYLPGSLPVSDVPSVPVIDTSFDDQVVYINEDEKFNFFISAKNVNGTPSVYIYTCQEKDDGTFGTSGLSYSGSMTPYDLGCYIGGWQYTPDASAGSYEILFMVKVTNTVGLLTESVWSGLLRLRVSSYSDGGFNSGDSDGSGDSGDDSETLGKLEELETDIQEVQDAVSAVGDKVDDLTGQVEEEMGVVQEQLEESNNKLEEVVESVTSLPQKIGDAIMGLFVPSEEDMAGIKDQWSELLSDRFGAVYDAVAIVDEIASSFKEQTTQGTITFPAVTIPLSGVDFEFGGWEVDVVPDGLDPFIQVVKKAIDIVCTLLFINGMKSRYEKTLEGRG